MLASERKSARSAGLSDSRELSGLSGGMKESLSDAVGDTLQVGDYLIESPGVGNPLF
jgi:hypothetical protein